MPAMMKFVMTAMFVVVLSGFSVPASAGEDQCECTARHLDKIKMREYLATMKAEKAAEEAAGLEAESAGDETDAAATESGNEDQTDG
jgi:hypothetical protein